MPIDELPVDSQLQGIVAHRAVRLAASLAPGEHLQLTNNILVQCPRAEGGNDDDAFVVIGGAMSFSCRSYAVGDRWHYYVSSVCVWRGSGNVPVSLDDRGPWCTAFRSVGHMLQRRIEEELVELPADGWHCAGRELVRDGADAIADETRGLIASKFKTWPNCREILPIEPATGTNVHVVDTGAGGDLVFDGTMRRFRDQFLSNATEDDIRSWAKARGHDVRFAQWDR